MSFMRVVPPVVEQLTTRMELQVRVEMCPINHYYLWREYREGCTGYCGPAATSECKVKMPRCSARNFAAVSQQFCESSWCLFSKEQVGWLLTWGGYDVLPVLGREAEHVAHHLAPLLHALQVRGAPETFSVDILNWDVFYCTWHLLW